MFFKSTAFLALFAVASRVAFAASPPACMLAAISTCPDPSDMKAVCSNDKVTSSISKNCGANTDAATSWFESACKSAGASVSMSTSSSASGSMTASATGSGSMFSSSTGTATARVPTGYGPASASGTAPLVTSAAGPTGFSTGTASNPTGGASNGTLPTTAGTAGPTASGSGAAASSSGSAYTGGAARLGMDVVGLAAIGAFGAMLAL